MPYKTAIKRVGPGLLLVGGVAFLGRYLADNYIANIGSVTLAIIIGMFAGNFVARGPRFDAGIHFAEKKLLPLAIILLGAELQLHVLFSLGLATAVLIIFVISSTMFASLFVGRLLGFSRSFSLLLGAGNAICGSSAIAAISPLVDGTEEDVGLSISAVNLLGTIGIFLLPALVNFLRLDDRGSGAVIGGSLQAIGHVVAAGYSVNDAVGNIALLVKMGRVLMLGPLAVVISWRQTAVAAPGQRAAVRVPPFIIGFLLVSVLVSWQIFPETVAGWFVQSGKWLLLLAMAGVGLKLRLETMVRQGPKTLFYGSLIAGLQLVVAALIVTYLL